MDNIVPSEKTNDINDVTKSPNVSLQYDKLEDDNEVYNIVPTKYYFSFDEPDDNNKLDYIVPSEKK